MFSMAILFILPVVSGIQTVRQSDSCSSKCRTLTNAFAECTSPYALDNCKIKMCSSTRFKCVPVNVMPSPSPSASPTPISASQQHTGPTKDSFRTPTPTPSPSAQTDSRQTTDPSTPNRATQTPSPSPPTTEGTEQTPGTAIDSISSKAPTPSPSAVASVLEPSGGATAQVPSVTPTPSPIYPIVFNADYNTLSCASGTVPKASELGSSECDVFDRRYELFVGYADHIPAASVCSSISFFEDTVNADTSCRMCGDGVTKTTTLYLKVRYGYAADHLSGNSYCDNARIAEIVSTAIYKWDPASELCESTDYSSNLGGSFITTDLRLAMPSILQDALCQSPKEEGDEIA